MDQQPPPPPPPSRNRARNVYHQENRVDLTLGLSPPDQVVLPLTCTYCKRTFSTPQALGGHQNAHREERMLANDHEVDMQEVNRREVANYMLGPDGYGGGGRRNYEVGQGSGNVNEQERDDPSSEKMDLNLKL